MSGSLPAAQHPIERQVVGALGPIGAATLASRVLGFVRDAVVALVFGAGPITDAFFVAYRIPNVLRRLVAEGALSTAVIPVFSDYLVTHPRAEFLRMLRAVTGGALVVLTATVAVGVATAPWLVRAIAPGFSAEPGQAALTVALTRVMFPYLLLVGVAALAMGALNAEGRFFASALGPAVANIGMIVGILWLAPRVQPPILSLALGVLIGGVGQVLVQVPSLARTGTLVVPALGLRHPALPRVARLLVPAVFGLAAVQVMVVVNTQLASLLPAGSISFLQYANRVMEFPLGVFGVALASASLPAMSRQAATGDTRGVGSTLSFALRLSLYVSAPATVGLVVLARPITQLLFERGRFSPDDTTATAWALVWYAVGLTGVAGARIAAQAFYAVGRAGVAVRLGILAVAVNVLAALALMGVMGHAALAAATSIGAYVNLVGLAWVARRRFGRLGGRLMLLSALRIVAGCVPLLLWCVAALWWIPSGGRLAPRALAVAIAIAGGAVIYAGATRVARSPEYPALFRALPGRHRR